MDQNEYARITAIVIHAALKVAINIRYPDLTTKELDYLTIDIIDRLARLRGFGVKREHMEENDDAS